MNTKSQSQTIRVNLVVANIGNLIDGMAKEKDIFNSDFEVRLESILLLSSLMLNEQQREDNENYVEELEGIHADIAYISDFYADTVDANDKADNHLNTAKVQTELALIKQKCENLEKATNC